METSWEKVENKYSYQQLKSSVKVKAVIIGGGITGVTAAYMLAKQGISVALIEKDSVYKGATAFTTAFITHIIDTPLTKLVRLFGEEKAKAIWQSHAEAIETIAQIIEDEEIKCDFVRCDEYIYALNEKEADELHVESELGRKMGFDVNFKNENIGFSHHGYLQVLKQAKFHPLKYVLELRNIAESKGAMIFENTEATSISQVDNIVRVQTKEGTIEAECALIATYDLFNSPKELFARKGPYTSYVIEAEIPKDVLKEGLYLDMKNPYHYFRVDVGKTSDNMIIGGEDHRDEVPISPEKNFRALEKYMTDVLDIEFRIVRKWNGPILEPVDGIPYIGRFSKDRDREYVAMGFSGNGMTYATMAANIFADAVMDTENKWAYVYDPRRNISLYQLWEKGIDYVGELFGGAVRNFFK